MVIAFDPNHSGHFIIDSTLALASNTVPHVQHAYLLACANLGQNSNTVSFAHTVVQPAFALSRDTTRGDDFIPIFSIHSTDSPPSPDLDSLYSPSLSEIFAKHTLAPLAEVYAKKK